MPTVSQVSVAVVGARHGDTVLVRAKVCLGWEKETFVEKVLLMEEGKTFEIQSDPIEFTRAMIPAMGWGYVDRQGHEHRWAKDESLPTLRWKQMGWTWREGDRMPVGYYVCRECGEEIDPPWIGNTLSEYIQGPTRYYINGVRVDKDAFEKEYNPFAEKLAVEAKEKRRQQYLSLKEEFGNEVHRAGGQLS